MSLPGPVLVTGCSSGIGRATAEHMTASGWTVYAGARSSDALASLAAAGCRPLELDVRDPGSVDAAVAAIEGEHGSVGVLVNNAAYARQGTVEETPLDEAKGQFETNLFAAVRVAQRVLPAMREQRRGRIVNVSSIGGRMAFPGTGFYNATKHALEAVSDAMRFEVRPWGIGVVLVEPGFIRTSFADKAVAGRVTRPEVAAQYQGLNGAVTRRIEAIYRAPVLTASPAAVARVIGRAASAPRPRARYPVPASARAILMARRLPDRVWDALLRSQYRP